MADSEYICTDSSPICSTGSTVTVTDDDSYPVIISTKSIDTTVNSNSVTTTSNSTDSEATISTSDPKTANRSTNVATEGLWKCSVCGFVIPELNKELHQLRCEREQRRLAAILKEKEKQGPAPSGKKISERIETLRTIPQKKKSKKAKSSATGTACDEDIDTLLAEMTQMDSRCNFPSCKKNANLLDITCPFCRRKFCMSHNMAEVHGCGDIAKRYARQELEKELRGEKGGGGKSTDAKKRAQLQRKLDKKIDDMASGRQKKKPSS